MVLLPFEHSRSRAYRWNEDGLAGWCDSDQIICLGSRLVERTRPILKERPYGLSNQQGNHGEDVKDYWFYTDNLPTHAYAAMVYKYPQASLPYDDLLQVNRTTARTTTSTNCSTHSATNGWNNDISMSRSPVRQSRRRDFYCRVVVTNRGPDPAPVRPAAAVVPQHVVLESGRATTANHQARPRYCTYEPSGAGERWFTVTTSDGSVPELVFCENETNDQLLFGAPNSSPTVKDGINDYVVGGNVDAVSATAGSKGCRACGTTLGPGETFTVTVRFAPNGPDLSCADADRVLALRSRGRRVLWLLGCRRSDGGRTVGSATGVRRTFVVQTVLQLPGSALAQR